MLSVSSLFTLALLPLAVHGAACRPGFCAVHSDIVSDLQGNADATAYCESLLDITAVTFAYTAAVSSSSSKPVYIYGRVVEPRLISSSAPASPSEPAAIPASWPAASASKVCSCLSIPTPSTTSTVTVSLAPSLVSVTSTATETPHTTVTSSSIEISISTSTYLSTSVSVVIETAYATATTIVANGAAYRRYNCPYNGDTTPTTFTSSSFNPESGAEVLSTGYENSLSFTNWDTDGVHLTTSSGDVFDATQAALVLQGFFVARETGTYTFSTTGSYIDNWGYLWTGDVSYADWNDGNADFLGIWLGTGTYETEVTMNEGDAIPFTWLWANGGGPGQSYFVVTSPDGTQTTDSSPFLVQACDASVFA
ncbi:hypothetical protein SEUCBS139899_009437 [Sporothrix eucalyptigena]|uniref:PA14 domain-containing protein n=1 Tax=Sporothrix eucalyptigena TaxID=1812306 RepID=A0ABP0CSZ6_9PEZI